MVVAADVLQLLFRVIPVCADGSRGAQIERGAGDRCERAERDSLVIDRCEIVRV